MQRLTIPATVCEKLERLEPVTAQIILGHIFDLRVRGLSPDVGFECETIRLLWPDIVKEYEKNDKASSRMRTVREQFTQEVPPSPQREKIPHTLLKEKHTSSPEESALHGFKKPTVEEVAEYCRANGKSIDPAQFVAFYEAKGWMIGKNRMKDWKAAVTTWERRQKTETPFNRSRKADNWRGTKPENMDNVL